MVQVFVNFPNNLDVGLRLYNLPQYLDTKKLDYIGRGDQPIPMKMISFGSINGPRAEFELNNISKALFCLSSSVEHEL